MNNFKVVLQAVLDSNGIGGNDITKIQKIIDKYHINLTTQLDTASMMAEIKKIVPQLESELSKIYNADIKISDKELLKAINQIGNEAEKTASKVKTIAESLNNGTYSLQIDQLKSQFQKFGLSADEAENKVKELRTTLSNMKSSSGNELVSNFQIWQNQIKGVKTQLDQAKLSFDKFEQPVSDEKITSLLLRIQNFLSKNTAITKEAKTQLELYLNELNGGVTLGRWNQINQTLAKTESEMRTLGKLGKSLKDQFSQAANSFTQWISVSSIIMFGVTKTKDAIKELKDLDGILTEIGKTSDRTLEQLQSLGKESYSHASKYGRTASDWLTGVQEMNRSGFQGQQGNDMADLSILAQAAGDLNRETADSYILAMNAAYGYEGSVKKLNAALDGMNQITNVNSTDMETMTSAITKAGSTASTTGVQINELSAMIGTISARTKESGEEVGTGIKSLLINLQNTSSDKIVQTLKKANVSMTEMKNGIEQLRSPIAILEDLQKVFNSLDSKDALKAEILTNIGQKYHANELAALLSGWSDYNKMLQDYSEGDGSAFEEAQKSANNLEGSLNKLSNTWTSTINNIANSSELTTSVKGLNGVLTVVNKITSALGGFGTISTTASGILGAKGLGLT